MNYCLMLQDPVTKQESEIRKKQITFWTCIPVF